jgi:hypothetical protein
MGYYDEQKEKAIKYRDEIFNDPGGGIYHIKDKKTGMIKKLKLPFVLENRMLNLWEGIRDDAISYFRRYDIDWHKDINGEPKEGPEGHLLSSNIACINHLFYLRKRQDLATLVLKNIDSRIVNSELVDDGYIEFEKMGGKDENPLKEKSEYRKRGSKSTSVDALMVGKKQNGKNILVLIEWKYTENYINPECKFIEKDDYHKNYTDLLQEVYCPIKSPENVTGLFFEPYYQLMRQTLLGWKMAETKEYNSDEYICLHIIPHGNIELRRSCFNWKNQLKEQKKYKIISPEDLLKPIINESIFIEYIKKRYW